MVRAVNSIEEGLHYRLPWPVDQVEIVNIAIVRRESVGLTETAGEVHIHDELVDTFRAIGELSGPLQVSQRI